MDHREILRAIDGCLDRAMARGLGKNGLAFPLDRSQFPEGELTECCERLECIFGQINEAYRYAEALANGELHAEASRTNIFAMPLKALHASLRHLTWQANQVAAGDLSQQVHFLGEFSQSFNRMIVSLREKEVLEQRLKTITDVLGEGVFLVDTEGHLIFANPEAERLLGYSAAELSERPLHHSIHRQHADGTRFHPDHSPLFMAIQGGREYNNDDSVFTCKSGLLMPVSLACRPVLAGGSSTGAVIAFHDITEQKKYLESLQRINDLLEKQATTDALTGIFNRLKLGKVLKLEIDRARRYRTPLSVILFDIDKFKSINDTFGHLEGDSVLRDMADLVGANIRSTDIFARWGGEEFMVVAPGIDLEGALLFAEKLRAVVAANTFTIARPVTSSFGVAAHSADDTDLTLTNRADHALYQAKEGGRNRVVGQEAPK